MCKSWFVMIIFEISWFNPSVIAGIVTDTIFVTISLCTTTYKWDSILERTFWLLSMFSWISDLRCQIICLNKPGPKVAPAAFTLLNVRSAKFCRHDGTEKSPLNEYRFTYFLVLGTLFEPPTVIRSISAMSNCFLHLVDYFSPKAYHTSSST